MGLGVLVGLGVDVGLGASVAEGEDIGAEVGFVMGVVVGTAVVGGALRIVVTEEFLAVPLSVPSNGVIWQVRLSALLNWVLFIILAATLGTLFMYQR